MPNRRYEKLEELDNQGLLPDLPMKFYPNNMLAQQTDFSGDQTRKITYYPNGGLRTVKSYSDGHKVGKQEQFDKDGLPNGRQEGYDQSGNIIYRFNYLHGRKNWFQRVWDESGKLVTGRRVC